MLDKYFLYSFYDEDFKHIGVVNYGITEEEKKELQKKKHLDYIIYIGDDYGK